MGIFDTHAHLTDERFDGDRDSLIESLPSLGVDLVMDVACDVREVQATLELANRYPFVYAAVGMHPHIAAETKQEHLDAIRRIVREPKVMAIGEIGLDYYYDFAPRDVQRKWFIAQLELARELDMPVILHIREAFGDCMDILRAHKGIRGVMHCYSGSVETAAECLDLGYYIALGGSVTFKNANKLLDVARFIPDDRLLLETDCPYMTPVPYRGERNDPTYTRFTARRIAELREKDTDELCDITNKNGRELFGISL